MSNEIRFSIRSIDGAEAVRQKWIAAGILEDAEGWQFKPAYDVEITATQGWDGTIARPTGDVDEEGRPVFETIPGWHANAIARGATYDAMTAGLEQHDAEGNLLPLMQRTWAAYIFGLTETQSIDPDSGFPYQAVTADGNIQYGDQSEIATPSNVRQ